MPDRLAPQDCLELMRGGVTLIDLREPAEFSVAHPPQAINIPFDGRRLAERITTVVGDGQRLILHAGHPAELDDAVSQCARTPLELAGVTSATPQQWRDADAPWVDLQTVATDALDADPAVRPQHVLDVREPMEWAVGHVPGAQLISLGELRNRSREIPTDRDIAVICEAGIRSSSAASFLQAAGFERVFNVVDGSRGWRANERPVQITEEADTEVTS